MHDSLHVQSVDDHSPSKEAGLKIADRIHAVRSRIRLPGKN